MRHIEVRNKVEWPDDPLPEQWPALYEAGATLQEIAERTGHTSKRVRLVLLAQGVAMRPKYSRPPAWHVTAAKMWARGATYAAIGRAVGRTGPAVRNALLRPQQGLAQAAVSGPIEPQLAQQPPGFALQPEIWPHEMQEREGPLPETRAGAKHFS